MALRIVPVNATTARAFVAAWHRHHQPPTGQLFTLGVAVDTTLVGVAIIGRPVARAYDDQLTVEVTRVATNGYPNTCSMLYGAAWRAAKARGYLRALTYTRADETGASLRAAGWLYATHLPRRPGWDMPNRPRSSADYDPIGRHRWCIGAWVRGNGELVPDRQRGMPTDIALPSTHEPASQLDLFEGVGR